MTHGVQRGCRSTESKAHAELVELVLRCQGEVARLPCTAKEVLGQRWPVIGKHRLCADESYLSVETGATDGLGGPEAAERGAEDEEPHL